MLTNLNHRPFARTSSRDCRRSCEFVIRMQIATDSPPRSKPSRRNLHARWPYLAIFPDCSYNKTPYLLTADSLGDVWCR